MHTKGHVTVDPLFAPSPRTAFNERGSLLLAPAGKLPAQTATSASESHGSFALANTCVMLFVIALYVVSRPVAPSIAAARVKPV